MRDKLWTALNGIFCVYKPVDLSITGLKKQIVKRICSDGNEAVGMPRLPTTKLPIVEPHEQSGALLVVGEREIQDYTQHPLVCGEAFRPEDIRLEEIHYMESTSSGVCAFALNDECDKIPEILARSWVNNYRLEGIFGRETNKHKIKGRVTLKADYDHVTRHRLEKLVTRVQSEYRRAAFQAAEVDLQSEEAFELARKGMPRAKLPGAQIIYGCEVKHFNLPYFALQVQSVGETDVFLRCFIHEIGVSLGTTASCVRLQRRSLGPFHAAHALLEKQISLQNIIRNIELCRRIMKNLPKDEGVIKENSSPYEEDRLVVDGLDMQTDQEYDAMRPVWPRNYT
ncbi:hypothetical protein ANCCAN_04129 [Ancylostoma caninum]|uniref:Pseudouridine synthase II N-terminal domain-containing protein n=1 Tax=Ancylostoma caninum TaxID=29170 RepID=A0A368GZV1_ANCCA|nr:hypothetical protein ANCCAN_04129 [Ancylostoma caninum]